MLSSDNSKQQRVLHDEDINIFYVKYIVQLHTAGTSFRYKTWLPPTVKKLTKNRIQHTFGYISVFMCQGGSLIHQC